MTQAIRAPIDDDPFARLLRAWRTRRRLSQLHLALNSGVSQRHLSFLESGRARPSRVMVLRLAEALEVPLRERNDWLLAGGFAPAFRARNLDDPEMAEVARAVRLMLSNHEPLPAAAVDLAWNVVLANGAFDRMAEIVGDDIWTRVGGKNRNLLRLFFHPDGLRPLIANWGQIGPALWQRAVREAAAPGGEAVQKIVDELAPFVRAGLPAANEPVSLVPVIPIELAAPGFHASFFTTVSTFGTPHDITAEELRIELFFPADDQTRALFGLPPEA